MTIANIRIEGPIGGRVPRTDTPGMAKPGRFVGAYESDPNWRNRAACLGTDPETWFPLNDAEYGPALLQAEDAKAICNNRCPVRDACLEWALATNQGFGVWGGLTVKERANLKRSQSRKTRSTAA